MFAGRRATRYGQARPAAPDGSGVAAAMGRGAGRLEVTARLGERDPAGL